VSDTRLGPATNISFSLKISFRQLPACYFVAPSLTRERVCNLLLLLVLAIAVPRDSIPYFIVPILENPPTWRARSPCLYPTGTGWPRYSPGHWVPFCRLLRLAWLRFRYSNPPPQESTELNCSQILFCRVTRAFTLYLFMFW
jgi:hypothetical protein